MPEQRLAIIGASGFVGSALCERLFFEHRTNFTPFIHTTGNAARIARLNLPFRQLDLLDREAVTRSLSGFSTIVNCSRSGDHRLMLRSLANLTEAARRNRVHKFIHIGSTIIYGVDPPAGSQSDSFPPSPGDNEYGQMKAKQDMLITALHRAGIQTHILCPPNITGPYSTFSYGLATRLAKAPLPIVDEGQYPCNLVHVDNLVQAILTAEGCTGQSGERYFVNEVPAVSWRQYLEDFCALLSIPARFIPVSRSEVLPLLQAGTRPRSSLKDHLSIAMSGEFRRGLNLMPVMQKMNSFASQVFDSLPPHLQKAIRARFQRPIRIAKQSSASIDDPYVFLQARRPYHSPDKLTRQLGYSPALSYREGLETTASWLRYTGVA